MLRRMILILPVILAASAVQAEQTTDAWMQRMLDEAATWVTPGAAPAQPTIPAKPALLVFVSFSMPDESLKALSEQVGRTGGVTVLRGLLDDSFRETALRIGTFAREHGPGFSVDPRLFAEYGVATVPTFIVVSADTTDKIAGNMSLAAALEIVSQEGDNRDIARELLNRLKGAP